MIHLDKKVIIFIAVVMAIIIISLLLVKTYYFKNEEIVSQPKSWEQICMEKINENIPDYSPKEYDTGGTAQSPRMYWKKDAQIVSCWIKYENEQQAGWSLSIMSQKPINEYASEEGVSFLKGSLSDFGDCSNTTDEVCRFTIDEDGLTWVYAKNIMPVEENVRIGINQETVYSIDKLASIFVLCRANAGYIIPIGERTCKFISLTE